jgi:hypothetical protein
MMVRVRPVILILATALALCGPALACDGVPPKLVNKDDKPHEVVLTCGSKTERRTVGAGASQELREKSGCTITLGDGKPTKLYTEMVCTISGGKLSCDLL